MKKQIVRVPFGVLAALIVLMTGTGAAVGGGCGGFDDASPTNAGGSSPPPIDRLAPAVFDTASFGFG